MKNLCLLCLFFLPLHLSAQHWSWVKSDFRQKTPNQFLAYDGASRLYLAFDNKLVAYDTSGAIQKVDSVQKLRISALVYNAHAGLIVAGTYSGVASSGSMAFPAATRDQVGIFCLDRNLNSKWAACSAGSGITMCNDACVAPDGRIMLTGLAIDTVAFGANGSYQDNFFLASVDSSGNWYGLSLAPNGQGVSLRTDSAGNTYVIGKFKVNTIFPGSSQYFTAQGPGEMNLVAKYDNNMNFVAAIDRGTQSDGGLYRINKDRRRNNYLVTQGRYACSVECVDDNLSSLYGLNYGWATYDTHIESILVTRAGIMTMLDYSFTGFFCADTVPQGFVLLNLHPSSYCNWHEKGFTTNGIEGYGLQECEVNGDLYVSGWYSDSANIGNFKRDTTGHYSVFIGKIPNGARMTTAVSEKSLASGTLNVTQDYDCVTVSAAGFAGCEQTRVRLYDADGRMRSSAYLSHDDCSVTFQKHLLSPGMMIVVADDATRVATRKVLVSD